MKNLILILFLGILARTTYGQSDVFTQYKKVKEWELTLQGFIQGGGGVENNQFSFYGYYGGNITLGKRAFIGLEYANISTYIPRSEPTQGFDNLNAFGLSFGSRKIILNQTIWKARGTALNGGVLYIPSVNGFSAFFAQRDSYSPIIGSWRVSVTYIPNGGIYTGVGFGLGGAIEKRRYRTR